MAEDLNPQKKPASWIEHLIRFCLQNRMIVFIVTLVLVGWGVIVIPFDWHLEGIYRDPVPVDAVPDIGKNQQIVFTEWAGHPPREVEDRITYPLSISLLGVPGARTLRSYSTFGFSFVYVIFEESIDFYRARTRVLESLSSLPSHALPAEVKPILGPDATAMGQVFWYTLEGTGPDGTPAGGWDLHELRTIQDGYVRYALMSVPGVSEVASVGGFVQEYLVDVDPDLMHHYQVQLEDVVRAVQRANVDVGARSIEVNRVEYIIRGQGFFKNLEDIRNTLIKRVGDAPILVENVAEVTRGPALRRGALDKDGAEAVGGVVVVRYGEKPLAVIGRVKEKIEEITLGLPKRTLEDGTVSQVRIVPFYDRTGLIQETLQTLNSALFREMLITVIVVLLMMIHIRSSLLISVMLPLSVLLGFVAMKGFGVDANIVTLSGIAIAIGTIVCTGVIVTENILRHLDQAAPSEKRLEVVIRGGTEVGGAILTAVGTTIVGFLPVFTLQAAGGMLFRPLAYTQAFVLVCSLVLALCLIPSMTYVLLGRKPGRRKLGWIFYEGLIYAGGLVAFVLDWKVGLFVAAMGGVNLLGLWKPARLAERMQPLNALLIAGGVALLLARSWRPMGVGFGWLSSFVFLLLLIGIALAGSRVFQRYYAGILAWCLDHKAIFLCLPAFLLLLGAVSWQGYGTVFGWLPRVFSESGISRSLEQRFPGLGQEFMPSLGEGAFLYMPVTMPHASISEVMDILQRQDRAIAAIPEVEDVVGKLGRVESPLDPALVSMIETLISYRTEFLTDVHGNVPTYAFELNALDWFRDVDGRPLNAPDGRPYYVQGRYARDENSRLVPDPAGKPFRLWRPPLDPYLNRGREAWPGIRKPDDIWERIVEAGTILGTTVPSKIQPISARIVMLQSGVRAGMGVKVRGPDLKTVETVSREIEKHLRGVPSIDPRSVVADCIVGKPYLEIDIDRRAIAQYGIDLRRVQEVIEIAIGGKQITTAVEGRERYPVRVRYLRELADHLDTIGTVLVPGPDNTQVPLSRLAEIRYAAGPQAIKKEGAFIVGYVMFDKRPGFAEATVVEDARKQLLEKIEVGKLALPPGANFTFAGNHENQVCSNKRLKVMVPLTFLVILIILYSKFKSVTTSTLVFLSVAVAWAGGFVMIWLYGQSWFLDFSLFGVSARHLLQVHTIHLSVAVWVGFLVLFGIASSEGVVMAATLDTSFSDRGPRTIVEIREATIAASLRRVRPCLMITATTILTLVPVLTATGRGSDILVPMAVPSFGGMIFEVITMLVMPVLYCWLRELRLKKNEKQV